MLAASPVSAEFQKRAPHSMSLPGPKAPQTHLGAQCYFSLLAACRISLFRSCSSGGDAAFAVGRI